MNMDIFMVNPINGDAFSTTGTVEPSAPSPANIARLKSRFSWWFDRLKMMSTGEPIFQLKIAAHLVSTYPDFLQTEEIRELLVYVVKITCQNYGPEMKSHCFKLSASSVFLNLSNLTTVKQLCSVLFSCSCSFYRLASVTMTRKFLQRIAKSSTLDSI